MKRILPLLVLVLVGVGLFVFLKGRESGPGGSGPIQFAALIEEASLAVNPDANGVPWPEDGALSAMRKEWHAWGFRDSTLLEELNRDWYYPAGNAPLRLTNLAQTPTGRGLTLRERLEFGEKLRKQPTWRMGSARFFPVLTVVLSTQEKTLLAVLEAKAVALPTEKIARTMDLSPEAVQTILDEFSSLGWVTMIGADSSITYSTEKINLRDSGALQFLTLVPESGRARDLVSFAGLLDRMPETLTQGLVTVFGPCSQTGKLVEMTLRDGQLRMGSPGNAWAASITPPGKSNGLFASERALTEWIAAHPEVTISAKGSIVEMYQNTMAESR